MKDAVSKFIPNSFQTPNSYLDDYMHLLSSDEWKVLAYAIRRIFGFQKRKDIIALSQFIDGITNGDGVKLDNGTGLCRSTVVKCLKSLVVFGFLIPLIRTRDGMEYALELDSENIEIEKLHERAEKKLVISKKKTAAARKKRKSVPQTNSGLSDRLPPVCDIDTQKTEGNKEEIQVEVTEIENTQRLNSFPAKIRAYATAMPELFDLTVPKSNTSQFKYWLKGLYQLKNACAEYGLNYLYTYGKKWKREKRAGGKVLAVKSPQSLVTPISIEACKLRDTVSGTNQVTSRGTIGRVINE